MPKKTKSVKASDISQEKPWLRRTGNSEYKIATVITNQTILIVCEGQTEKLYFESFPVVTITVKAVNLKGQTKLKLVNETQKIVNNSSTKFDQIWCVFDMDIKKGAKEFADFDNAIAKARSLSFKAAYSNDCFELWFYLHYQHTDQKNHRTFYYKELSRLWKINYPEDGKKENFCLKIYRNLLEDKKASQEGAIKNAKKIYENQKNLTFHKQNPVTLVFELVQILNKNLKK